MAKITGLLSLFVSMEKGFPTYSATIGSKNEDGSYNNVYVEVKFTKDNFPKEKLEKLIANMCYSLNVKDGFLTATSYTAKDGTLKRKLVIMVVDATIEKATKCEAKPEAKKSNDLPF